MTTPRLNRIFRVGGSSTETVRLPIQWGFDTRLLTGFVGARDGEWYPWKSGERPTDATLTAQGLITFGATGMSFASVSVDSEGAAQAGVPGLLATLSRNDESHWVRLATPDSGDSYLQWNLTRYWGYADSFDLNLSGGQLVGSDFDLNDDDYVLLSFERHTAEQSVTTVTARPVWGELIGAR